MSSRIPPLFKRKFVPGANALSITQRYPEILGAQRPYPSPQENGCSGSHPDHLHSNGRQMG
eukprot:11294470-Ditylum_brightwellii.AAC.1